MLIAMAHDVDISEGFPNKKTWKNESNFKLKESESKINRLINNYKSHNTYVEKK